MHLVRIETFFCHHVDEFRIQIIETRFFFLLRGTLAVRVTLILRFLVSKTTLLPSALGISRELLAAFEAPLISGSTVETAPYRGVLARIIIFFVFCFEPDQAMGWLRNDVLLLSL